MHAGFKDAETALTFLRGGNAKVTLSSKKTGKHFTFTVKHGWDWKTNSRDFDTPLFVKVLTRSDNMSEKSFTFIGFIPKDGDTLIAGRKGRPDAPSFKALRWALAHLVKGNIPADLEIRHEGSCSRCGRALTVPESIDTGMGPVCRTKMEAG